MATYFRRWVDVVAQREKQDTRYHLDPNMTLRALLQVLIRRGFAFMRGLFQRIWLGKSSGTLFVGRQVRLLCPQYISAGRGVIIDDYVSIDALSQQGVELADNVTIAKFVTIQCSGVIRHLGVGLRIGSNSAIGAYSFLGAQGGITIGKNVIMGPRVSLHAENHIYTSLTTPIRLQGEERQGIVIEDDCWIGAGAIILDGVQIGAGCVVAAGSVVTKNVPAYSVIAGVPAKVLKSRLTELQNP
jgi:acetyltransferase-like isoleucine patch superfamily enzyme